jgi:Ca2+-binding EF-hand superfamily protein
MPESAIASAYRGAFPVAALSLAAHQLGPALTNLGIVLPHDHDTSSLFPHFKADKHDRLPLAEFKKVVRTIEKYDGNHNRQLTPEQMKTLLDSFSRPGGGTAPAHGRRATPASEDVRMEEVFRSLPRAGANGVSEHAIGSLLNKLGISLTAGEIHSIFDLFVIDPTRRTLALTEFKRFCRHAMLAHPPAPHVPVAAAAATISALPASGTHVVPSYVGCMFVGEAMVVVDAHVYARVIVARMWLMCSDPMPLLGERAIEDSLRASADLIAPFGLSPDEAGIALFALGFSLPTQAIKLIFEGHDADVLSAADFVHVVRALEDFDSGHSFDLSEPELKSILRARGAPKGRRNPAPALSPKAKTVAKVVTSPTVKEDSVVDSVYRTLPDEGRHGITSVQELSSLLAKLNIHIPHSELPSVYAKFDSAHSHALKLEDFRALVCPF